ncbi:MAG: DivIVA domain-containing protein [Oscillospiraceae bacterium]|nr:DivIVA domain-containing protein [Oscillospiraceae bacterium]
MDRSLFDLSGIELVKKKYYNASKVTERLESICAEYDRLSAENGELKEQLQTLSSQKNQISDTLMSAQSIAQQIIEDAKTQADSIASLAQTQAEEIVKAAEKKAELILAGARTRKDASDKDVSEVQDYALKCVENCVEKLRRQHMEAIEYLNAQWQDFLSGLIIPGDEQQPELPEAEPDTFAQPQQPVDWMAIANMELPEIDDPYADIDADTFFSGNFFAEQSGVDILGQLKSMMDSIERPEENE